MKKVKRIICIILVLLVFAYSAMNFIIYNYSYATVRARTTDESGITENDYPGILPLIQELRTAHPNWTFTFLYTGLDWSTVIANETTAYHGRSLVQNSSPEWVCSTCGTTAYDNGSWYCASTAAVEYYMDVRNWLNESNIFAFEALSYDRDTQTIDGVKAILRGTFMDVDSITYTDIAGNTQVIYKSYAQIIMEAAEESGVSPYHLASRLKQEQGSSGGSALINGTYPGYVGYYNYFNIGATGSNATKVIENGLKYAESSYWTSPEIAIKGGAAFIASGYIGKYQDTLYLEKYHVDSASPNSLYSHQYMQNISAPYSEGYSVYTAYSALGMLNYSFNFIIPIYENMPAAISQKPANNVQVCTDNVTVIGTSLNIRSSKSTNSSLLGTIPYGTNLLRIEIALAETNGYYWDKIMYINDSQVIIGYVARNYIAWINDIVSTNEVYYTNTYVNLRNGPGTSGTIIKMTLNKDTKLTVIDKMTCNIGGYIWYRVKLDDGTQGYIASNYLTTEDPNAEKVYYKIVDNYILTIPEATIANIENAQNAGEVFGTGAQIIIGEQSYTLVMLGDANGDGLINSGDLLRIQKCLLGVINITEEPQIRAADANSDGTINSGDLLKIQKHLLNVAKIKI